jgi:predicted Zn-dependent peptidase
MGSLRFLQEYPLRLAAVTTDQVRQAALRYLRPTRKCVVELRRPTLRIKPVVTAVAPPASSPSVTSANGVNRMMEQSRHSKAYAAVLDEILATPLHLPAAPQVGKEVQRIVLPSGITLFLLEDQTRPQVTLDFVWLGGINSAPIRDLDAYQLGAGILSSAGTETRSPEELSERKRELGMSFVFSFGSTTSEAALFSPAQTFDASYDLAMEILMRPRLGERRLCQRKISVLDSMRARSETLGSGAGHVLHHVLAAEHPRLGYVPGKWRLLLTTWPYHIRRLWHRYLGRDNLYIAAVGNVQKQTLINKIESTLGRWRLAEDSQRVFLARPPVIAKGAFLVRKSLPGAAVILAHQIPIDRTASEQEHAALRMLQAILGRSDLQSRLHRRLRAQEGLTYGVSMSLEHEGRPGVPGQVTVSYQTKTGQVFRSIVCVLEELERLRTQDVSPAELKEQQERWRNQLAISYSDRTASVQRIMSHELADRPSDFDQRVLAAIEQVTPADIRRVAQKYIHPELLTVALFGTLSPEEEAQIKVRFGLKILTSRTVFRGGYD